MKSSLAESTLYHLAKWMYARNPGQSTRMTAALNDTESYDAYRRECVGKVLDAARNFGVDWTGKDVLDLGCFDGALTRGYADAGARTVTGVDIDTAAVESARRTYGSDAVRFDVCDTTSIPLDNESVDVIFCYDVMEHVAQPAPVLAECARVLRSGGKMLIGTWGWHHPYAPHLWSIMPVPWAHVAFSERTLLRTCRRIYNSAWYVPNMHDFDENGQRKTDKFNYEEIPRDYLNKFLIQDFEKVFAECPLDAVVHPQRFSTRWAAWTTPLTRIPWLKEFFTAYIWVVLTRDAVVPRTQRREFRQPELETTGAV
ncbi:MAG: class I SAM-dependent methyltransferase [Planctomycetaceae bacterium]